MPSFNRSDEFFRAEKGPDWFNDFLLELSKASNVKSNSAVENITQKYKEDVGLNLLQAELEKEKQIIITASKKALSKRAQEKISIKDMPKVQEAVDSFCRNSGGTKNAYAILNYLRQQLGKENISYTDQELLDYINEIKNNYKENRAENFVDVGKIGTEKGDYGDSKADYFAHSKPQ